MNEPIETSPVDPELAQLEQNFEHATWLLGVVEDRIAAHKATGQPMTGELSLQRTMAERALESALHALQSARGGKAGT